MIEKIAKYMRDNNLSQTELSRRTGVNNTLICKILKGQRNVSLAVARSLSKEMNITIDELVEG